MDPTPPDSCNGTPIPAPTDHGHLSPFTGLLDGERRYFRWRGEGVSRVENFSDAVFAFALTLLVVSTEVPHSYAALIAVLSGFPAFALSFLLLVAIWYNHYLYFRRYGLHDTTTIALNNGLLLVVLFCIYPLKFICLLPQLSFGAAPPPETTVFSTLQDWQFAVLLRVYATALGSIFLLLALLYGRAWRLREALQLTRAERLATLRMLTGFSITILACVASGLLTFNRWSVGWSSLLYLLLVPALVINGMVFRRRIRQAAHAPG